MEKIFAGFEKKDVDFIEPFLNWCWKIQQFEVEIRVEWSRQRFNRKAENQSMNYIAMD